MSITEKINLGEIKVTDLNLEFEKAYKDKNFKLIVDKLKIDKSILKNYTSTLEDCAIELSNCQNCKSIHECKNKICGYTYLPTIKNNQLNFHYKPCKFMETNLKKYKFTDNIKYFSCPKGYQDISIKDIIKTDKNRFETIKWLNSFEKEYLDNSNIKGLYLHGNFGCGKTYLVVATLNDLATKNVKSAVVFWPEFIRQAFYDDFKEKFEYIKKVPVLLIDDLGAENLTSWNRDEILCPILQYRMDEQLPTFITSNFNLEEMEQHLSISKQGVDIVKAKRIMSRIMQLTEQIEMLSKNLRK